MSKIRTHIILLSERVLPDVLPVLDYNLKPERVVLCESDEANRRGIGRRVAPFLKSNNVKVDFFRIGSADDFSELHKKFAELASKHSAHKGEVAVNLGSGNELMAVAAQSVFSAGGFTFIYAVPERNQMFEIDGGKVRTYQLQEKIKLSDYFLVQGCRLLSKREKNLKLISGSHVLCRELLSDFEKYGKHLTYLARLAAGAESHFSLKAKARITNDNKSLFELFSRNGFIARFDAQVVEFSSEEDSDFCKGIWLEDYLHQTLKGLGKDAGLQDFATFVEVENSAGTRFELDAAFLCKNILYVIDAKLDGGYERNGEDPYRLEWLRDLDRLCTVPIVVSFRELRNQDLRRVERMGVHVLQSNELVNLEQALKKMLH